MARDAALTLTARAAAFLAADRTAKGVPQDWGLRVRADQGADGKVWIRLGFAAAPEDGDEVVESHGTRVFVHRAVAEHFPAAVVDLGTTPRGPELLLLPSPMERGV